MSIEPRFFVARDGVRLAWREMGEGRPLVLLHGLFSTAEVNWIKFGTASRIAREGFRVIMPDLRVHGSSEAPHEPEHYPPDVLVHDLEDLIAHLGLADFDLGGFSLGARTSTRAVVAGMKPQRLILGGMGLAGLAGCALSQVGNVGPDLGQGYIVDSFLVVVLGGVGQLAGTVYAALGLGVLNKLLEGWQGAVLAKIMVLVFIVVFIQKRPQGLFALKGRSAEA